MPPNPSIFVICRFHFHWHVNVWNIFHCLILILLTRSFLLPFFCWVFTFHNGPKKHDLPVPIVFLIILLFDLLYHHLSYTLFTFHIARFTGLHYFSKFFFYSIISNFFLLIHICVPRIMCIHCRWSSTENVQFLFCGFGQ